MKFISDSLCTLSNCYTEKYSHIPIGPLSMVSTLDKQVATILDTQLTQHYWQELKMDFQNIAWPTKNSLDNVTSNTGAN